MQRTPTFVPENNIVDASDIKHEIISENCTKVILIAILAICVAWIMNDIVANSRMTK